MSVNRHENREGVDIDSALEATRVIVFEPKVRECFKKIGSSAEWIGKIPCVGEGQKNTILDEKK